MRYAQLKAFYAVAKWGGFSRGAKQINLTQPAVSDHVRKLEDYYGIQLFVRSKRSITLTETGRKLFLICEQLVENERQASDLLSRARGLKEGSLTIGADAAVHVLPLLAKFGQKYPHINLSITAGNSVQLIKRLESLEIDFAVVANKPASDKFISYQLSKDGFVAFSASSRNDSGLETTSLSELVKKPLVLREKGSATRHVFEQACIDRKLSFSRVIEVEGREAARDAVAAGLGIGVISKAEFVADSRLSAITISDWNEIMHEWLVCLQSRAGLHIISALLEEARPKNPAKT